MGLFDLYRNTTKGLKKQGEDYLNCITQFFLRDREKSQGAIQIMAVFMPDDIRRQEAVQLILDYHQYMDDQVKRTGSQAGLVEKTTDLDRMLDKGKWAFIRSVESEAALNKDLDSIDHPADLNLRMLGLVWNRAGGLGSRPGNDTRLTVFGKEIVKRAEQVDMIVGCFHLSDAEFGDLLNITKCPFVVSYSNVRTCCGHPRNLMGTQSKEIVRREGLYGLSLLSWFVDDDSNGSKNYLLRHIYHILELGGEDMIAWDRDMDDEITCDPDLGIPYGVRRFTDYLTERGIGEAAVQGISFGNTYWFFK